MGDALLRISRDFDVPKAVLLKNGVLIGCYAERSGKP